MYLFQITALQLNTRVYIFKRSVLNNLLIAAAVVIENNFVKIPDSRKFPKYFNCKISWFGNGCSRKFLWNSQIGIRIESNKKHNQPIVWGLSDDDFRGNYLFGDGIHGKSFRLSETKNS